MLEFHKNIAPFTDSDYNNYNSDLSVYSFCIIS